MTADSYIEKYPYFIYPDVMALHDPSISREQAVRHRRRIAANIGDIPSLRMILDIDPEEFATFYPDMKEASPSTFDTIDSFLEKFGTGNNVPESLAPQIEKEQPIPALEMPKTVEEAKKLANSLIKEHRYIDAMQIISGPLLNNPEKNIYFADQMRFLKKLILNETSKTKSRG